MKKHKNKILVLIVVVLYSIASTMEYNDQLKIQQLKTSSQKKGV